MDRGNTEITETVIVKPQLETEWVVAEDERSKRVGAMVRAGQELTENKYGQNSGDPKPYHNEQHVLRIVIAVELIGKEEELTDTEIDLLKIAAAWHDVELSQTEAGANEDASAKLCEGEMKNKGWDEDDAEIEVVKKLIEATKYDFDKGFIQQSVGKESEMVSKYRVGRMRRVLADTDISGNGAPWKTYEDCGKALGKEAGKYSEGMTDEQSKEFWKWQVGFLDGLLNRRGGFYTEGAKKAFPHMASNLEEAKKRAGM